MDYGGFLCRWDDQNPSKEACHEEEVHRDPGASGTADVAGDAFARQSGGSKADARSDSAQGGRGSGWTWLGRWHHRPRAGSRQSDGGAGAKGVRGRGHGSGLGAPQASPPVRADVGWRRRGPSGRSDLPEAAGRSEPVDAETAGRPHGRTGICGAGLVSDRASDAKKNELKPWLSKQWCIPPRASAEFVWKMEDVLEVYKRPYDPKRPVVCLDETSKQLIGEVQTPVPAAPGRVAHYDYEYVRNGVANIFMICEPLAGQRDVEVTDRRTKKDYAECLQKLADEKYPDAEVIG